jgi:prevent-host-death family protein
MKSLIPKIPAGEFKAKCLHLLDEVYQEHIPLIITKRGKPVAKLVPIEDEKPQQIFGYLQGSVKIVGDIGSPIDEKWEADE